MSLPPSIRTAYSDWFPLPFVPDYSKEDRKKAIERLQPIMANGKPNEREIEYRPKKKAKVSKPFNKFDQITQEIEERQKWLAEMEELGEAHNKYRDLINMQIEEKLRKLDEMKVTESPK